LNHYPANPPVVHQSSGLFGSRRDPNQSKKALVFTGRDRAASLSNNISNKPILRAMDDSHTPSGNAGSRTRSGSTEKITAADRSSSGDRLKFQNKLDSMVIRLNEKEALLNSLLGRIQSLESANADLKLKLEQQSEQYRSLPCLPAVVSAPATTPTELSDEQVARISSSIQSQLQTQFTELIQSQILSLQTEHLQQIQALQAQVEELNGKVKAWERKEKRRKRKAHKGSKPELRVSKEQERVIVKRVSSENQSHLTKPIRRVKSEKQANTISKHKVDKPETSFADSDAKSSSSGRRKSKREKSDKRG
jgi:hypothetical protein